MMSRTLRLSDGRAVRFLDLGSGAPVVLVHGVGLRAEAWGPQMARLAEGHRVLAVDMPGHGGSDALPGTPLLPDYVAWAAKVIRALDLGPVSLAGHSMGALIAAGVAVEHSGLVTRLALMNAVHRRTPEARQAVLARAAEIAAGGGDIDTTLDRWFAPDQARVRAEVAGWLLGADPKGYAAAYAAFARGDNVYADRLAHIRCPALVITGADDGNSTPAMARAMADAMPEGRALVIEGHRHMVVLTAPEAVSDALIGWLEGVTA